MSTLYQTKKLTKVELYKPCNPATFKAETTQDITPIENFMGQNRVLSALEMAIEIKNTGYNVFALGPNGIGKQTITTKFFQDKAKHKALPSDFCYVYNFNNKEKPNFIEFKAGEAKIFKEDMNSLIKELQVLIPSSFKNITYRTKLKNLEASFLEKHSEKIQKLQAEALKEKINIVKSAEGFVLVLVDDKKQPVAPDYFSSLPKEKQELLTNELKRVQHKLEKILLLIPVGEQEKQLKIQQENIKLLEHVIIPALTKMETKWAHNPVVLTYLEKAKAHLLLHPEYFVKITTTNDENTENPILSFLKPKANKYSLTNFEVNVILDNSHYTDNNAGAPVIVLENPNYAEVFGKIEYMSELGSLNTNFTLIKAGALHRANGGYLILDARKILEIPFLWDKLKRAIKSRSIQVVNQESAIYYGSSFTSIEPQAIPLNVKIILLGEPDIYYALLDYDKEFEDLFKICADFDQEISYNNENIQLYASLVASLVEKEKLQPLNKTALARTIEFGARIAESQENLTTRVSLIKDLIVEANFFALKKNKNLIELEDIELAYTERRYRASKVHTYMQKQIQNRTILIETQGEQVGQINGLSIFSIHDFMFGQPQRISCTVYKGKTGIIDIEKSVNLSGAIHSKGVFILSAYLHSLFSKEISLAFTATLSFEQSYGKIDGDSASGAELFALLSSLADLPIKQSFAVTGSVDQKGRIQPIVGVNEKIEGFFDICQKRGLNSEHAVIIPQSNVKNLMLKKEVIESIDWGLFNIYAISSISEGVELLTGIKAGVLQEDGLFEENSVYRKIQDKWLTITKDIATAKDFTE